MRLKMVVSMLRQWCFDTGGSALAAVADTKFPHLQQLCLLLMTDKDMLADPSMVDAICPALHARQIEHVLMNWNANEDNAEPVSGDVLAALQARETEANMADGAAAGGARGPGQQKALLDPYDSPDSHTVTVELQLGTIYLHQVPLPMALGMAARTTPAFAFLPEEDNLTS